MSGRYRAAYTCGTRPGRTVRRSSVWPRRRDARQAHRMAGEFLHGVFIPAVGELDGVEVIGRQLGTRNPALEGMVRDEIVTGRAWAEAGLVMGGAR